LGAGRDDVSAAANKAWSRTKEIHPAPQEEHMSHHHAESPRRPRRTWASCFAIGTATSLTLAVGGIVMATHGTPATAAHGTASAYRLADDPVPAAGKTWIQGIVTDQANHALDNVNVEVWPVDPAASEPVASNLTYAGTPADQRHQHGVFRVEVPMNEPYVIVLSAVNGTEDGDPFRMKTLGDGRPIMARTDAGAGLRSAPGRVLDLGTFQLARQAKVTAQTTAKLAKRKIEAGSRARLRLAVTSEFVAAPAGKLVIHSGGKKITERLRTTDRGKTTVRLPKITKPGKHRIRVAFRATSTIRRSVSKPVVLEVT
jgi:ribosomal protein L18E